MDGLEDTKQKERTKKRHAFFFLAFFVLFVCFDLGFLPSKLRLAFFLHFDGARKVVVRFSSLASFFCNRFYSAWETG